MALRNGEFLFREMVHDGRVLRSHKDGVSRIRGYLEDYAAVALGALALYELTFERGWLDHARSLADAIARWFWDDKSEVLYDTAHDHEQLVTRPRDVTDNATPAGASLAIDLFLRLGDLLGDAELTRKAGTTLASIAEPMTRHPLAFGFALTASDLVVNGAVEVAIVGDPAAAGFRSLERALGERYVPSLVTAGGSPANDVELLKGRTTQNGSSTAYVCKGYVCKQPVTTPEALDRQLEPLTRPGTRP